MRIVLDTNVLVSALLVQGSVPDRVLDSVLAGRSHPLVDGRIMREYRAVLRRREFGFSATHVEDLLALFDRGEWIIADPLPIQLPDLSDLPLVEVAVAGGADAIVRGNTKHFQVRGSNLDIDVLTPRQYVTWLARRPPGR